MAANVIVRKGDLHRWHDEKRANGTDIKPGYLVELMSTGKVKAHATRGGRNSRWFAKEDYLRGGSVTGGQFAGGVLLSTTSYTTDELVPIHKARQGDVIQCVLKVLESVVVGDYAISNGDGRVAKAASSFLLNNAAASSAVTNTVTETTFSNGTITIPANSLRVGDVIRIRGFAVASATNSTDTLTIKVKIGSTAIITTAAVDVANGDEAYFDLRLTIRTIGASGTFVADFVQSLGVPGTVTAKPGFLGSTAIDTTAANSITVTATWSVANAGNIVALQSLTAEQVVGGTSVASGQDIVGQFTEVLDLSAASADDFVNVEVMF